MPLRDDIKAIVEPYLTRIKPSGSDNIMAICPFHKKPDGSPEHNPSFALSLATGLWFCHACQAKGNLFTFLRDIGLSREQIEFQYRRTIDAAGKNMPAPFDTARPAVFTEDPLPESLLGLFDYCPRLLLEEGYTEETLRNFEVGFDAAHYRITYPIRDLSGRLMAISGRTVIDANPRYKIYDAEYIQWGLSARQAWNKSGALWNVHTLYPEIYFQSRPERLVIVEGFKACMWLWQAGIKNVVALLGTYLSDEQLWILERMGSPVYLFLDNNDPGIRGTEKCGIKLNHSLVTFIVDYPARLLNEEDAQPDWLSPQEIHEQLNAARSFFEWRIN
jgi:DNA primase